MNPQTFGDLLRRLRLLAGLTQEELAEQAGMSVRGVSDLERGRNRFPYRATVARLIEVLQPDETEVGTLWALAARRKGPAPPAGAPRAGSVPRPLTALLGRERELASVLHMLRWEGVRLLTLTGPGGVGKTRLALAVAAEAAADYEAGATFVSLGAVAAPAQVPATIASTLGIRDAGPGSVEESLIASLAEGEHLLLLDNFEQLVPAGPFIAELLGACPRVKVLLTSRMPLRIGGEYQFDVAPLQLPDVDAVAGARDLVSAPAGALFLERARAVNAALRVGPEDARAIADICARLDGLPLALELAAGQVKYQSPQSLLAQIPGRLHTLAQGNRDLPARQQTLRDTIDWSYRLLQPEEQTLFRRIAVFAGGATIDAARAVCTAGEPALYTLRDASLLVLDGAEPERVRLLETIRSFAHELLEASGEAPALRDLHLDYYLHFGQKAEAELTGPHQADWFDRLGDERYNLQAALRWAEDGGRVEDGLRLLTALRLFWAARGNLAEARGRLERLLAAGEGTPNGVERVVSARALGVLGRVCWDQGDLDGGEAALRHALSLLTREEDAGISLPLLNNLAGLMHDRNDLRGAQALYRQALDVATALDDRWHLAAISTNLGNVASDLGELDEAGAWLRQGLAGARALGETRVAGMNLNVLGEVLRLQGRLIEAAAMFREALRLLDTVSDRANLAYSLDCLARVARDEGDPQRAATLVGAAGNLRLACGMAAGPQVEETRVAVLADCEEALGRTETASAREEGAAMSLRGAVAYGLEVSGAEDLPLERAGG